MNSKLLNGRFIKVPEGTYLVDEHGSDHEDVAYGSREHSEADDHEVRDGETWVGFQGTPEVNTVVHCDL